MTNQPSDSQQYWQIQLPLSKFPQSKFQFGNQTAVHWEDDQGNRYDEIGVIVGMEYIARGNQPAQWYYRMHILKCSREPWLVGSYDDCYKPESFFVADNSAIAD